MSAPISAEMMDTCIDITDNWFVLTSSEDITVSDLPEVDVPTFLAVQYAQLVVDEIISLTPAAEPMMTAAKETLRTLVANLEGNEDN